jgi:prepilin-type N-terminal cleavage/methylation domain-containing protein
MLVRPLSQAASRKAFTLTEMLIVVAIIVVLAGSGTIIYFNVFKSAKTDVARAHIKNTLVKAVQTYRLKNKSNQPPSSLAELVQAGYLEESALIDPFGNPYQYQPADNKDGCIITCNSPEGVISNLD